MTPEAYKGFEDLFRGSRETITARLKIYLPLFSQVFSDVITPKGVDLGCGRCEWLELISKLGWDVYGVDLNSAQIAIAEELKLKVIVEDVIVHLKSLSADSLDFITGFHIIEHLSPENVEVLIAETYRVLKPNGLLLLETPNPENLTVSSWSFYIDPTHEKPIPPLLLNFYMTNAGFENTEIWRLNGLSVINSDSVKLSDAFESMFLSLMDYSAISVKGKLSNFNLTDFVNARSSSEVIDLKPIRNFEEIVFNQKELIEKLLLKQSELEDNVSDGLEGQINIFETNSDILRQQKNFESRYQELLQEFSKLQNQYSVFEKNVKLLSEKIDKSELDFLNTQLTLNQQLMDAKKQKSDLEDAVKELELEIDAQKTNFSVREKSFLSEVEQLKMIITELKSLQSFHHPNRINTEEEAILQILSGLKESNSLLDSKSTSLSVQLDVLNVQMEAILSSRSWKYVERFRRLVANLRLVKQRFQNIVKPRVSESADTNSHGQYTVEAFLKEVNRLNK